MTCIKHFKKEVKKMRFCRLIIRWLVNRDTFNVVIRWINKPKFTIRIIHGLFSWRNTIYKHRLRTQWRESFKVWGSSKHKNYYIEFFVMDWNTQLHTNWYSTNSISPVLGTVWHQSMTNLLSKTNQEINESIIKGFTYL